MDRVVRFAVLLPVTVALSAALTGSASAQSPLLSGYGGPGAGEQSIIGAAFLNVPSGGGGSGRPGGSDKAGGSSAPGTGGRSEAATTGSGSTLPASEQGRAQGTQSAFTSSGSLRSTTGDSGVLGFSGLDLLLVALVLGALGLVGAFTRRLARLQR
jgi:hypothetical protein